jgi:RNA polymerase sigma-70 factor (ECF subfamily)
MLTCLLVNHASQDPLKTAWGVFLTTRWTMVLNARDPTDEAVSPALSSLCRTYWPPLYAFLRRQGYSSHDAQDLVQGFFERFLDRDYLRSVDRDKGRFRSFLLVSLRHFVANTQRDERAQRRGGGAHRISLDEPGVIERCEAGLGSETAPELALDREWAETVMTQAARRLRSEFESRQKGALYETLRGWLAKEPEIGEYARTAPSLGLTEGALAAAVFRMRQRFRELVREEVAHTVRTPEAVDDEMRYLAEVMTTG